VSFQITENVVQQYTDNMRVLYQQKLSRAQPWCQTTTIKGQSKAVERAGKTEAYDILSRHADTKYVETPHSRRWIDLQDKGWAELVDELDEVRLLSDPKSAYPKIGMMALNRAKDDIILQAARGPVRTNTGTITLPASQKIAASASNLTLAKLLTAKQILDQNEVDDDMSMAMDGQSTTEASQRVMFVNSAMLTSLYGTTELKSIDYNTVKALAQGAINTFLGFRFVRTERLFSDANATTGYAIAWSRSCVGFGVGQDIVTGIDPLPGKNYAVQVYLRMAVGAARLEDEGVVEIACS
jgi:hypothetical protein